MDSYLKVLEDQISHARDQYRLRAERELEKSTEKLEREEYWSKLSQIEDAAEKQIPRFFRIGALVPIWGLFESFLSDFALWVGKRETIGVSFRDIRAQNFRGQIEKYFEGILRVDLPWSAEERERLGYLQELRNFVAHRNGRLMDLPPEKEREIKALIAKVPGVGVEDSTLVVSAAYIKEAAALVFEVVGRLNQKIADRYAYPASRKSS
ncbi:MAG: hypothetical protein EPO20_23200 [Betaproteobacteria bacterium]|nr:MAG: hypothetical protein EPO20_23200 [Betaproteobacteria bacterium]